MPDSRRSNIPKRYNGAPSQEPLVIHQNHETDDLLKCAAFRPGARIPNTGEANQCHGGDCALLADVLHP